MSILGGTHLLAAACPDVSLVKAAFGSRAGQPRYDARADLNSDGVVDLYDLSAAAQNCRTISSSPRAKALAVATTISVQPPVLTAFPGQTIMVTVDVSNITDLYAFQFDLGFDPALLSAVSVTEGPFLPSGGPTLFIPGTIDNTAGTITFNADTLLGAIPGVSGSGTLVTITFKALTTGTSAVTLSNVILLDSTLNNIGAMSANGLVNVQQPDAFQVRYAANLAIGDSFINFTNTGAGSTSALPTQDGNLCVNVYAFSPDEQLISCCSCLLTPNSLASLSARSDLISNTLTPGLPTAIVVKLLASTGTGTTTACNASTVGTGTNMLVSGLSAWGTSLHALPVTPGSPAVTYGETETPFTVSTLSPAELTRLTTLCGLIQTNGSGFGICKSCRLGGLGGVQK